MESLKQSLSVIDIVMFTLSLFLPFIINTQSEKIKKRKLDTSNLRFTLKIISNDINLNLEKLDSSSLILEEFINTKTKYYGRNLNKLNRLKNYWMELLISDFKSVTKIDLSNLNSFNSDVYVKVQNHNRLIENIKETLKYDNNKLLGIKDVSKLVKLMKLYSKELRSVHSLALKLLKELEMESTRLVKTYKIIFYISKIISFLCIIFIIGNLGYFIFLNKFLLSINIIKTVYWIVTFVSIIFILLVKIIL